MMKRIVNFGRRVADLYVDGFRSMTVGRQLWILIIIKLVLIFVVMKLLFFPTCCRATMTPTASARRRCVTR